MGKGAPAKRDAGERFEDEVEASRAPLMDHLIELRQRLILVMAVLGVAFLACFFVSQTIYNLLLIPYQDAASALRGVPVEELDLEVIFLAPLEFFFTRLKLALFGAILIIFPVIAWQIYGFVAPGLYHNERGAFAPFLILSPLLFWAGAAMVYFVVLPFLMRFSLGQEQVSEAGQASIQLLLNVTSYTNLVTTLMLVFGVSFQMPVLMMLLAKAGLVRASTLLKGWRFAIFGIVCFAAFVTPPDPISQIFLGIVLVGLYFLSILGMRLMESGRDGDEADDGEDAARA